MTNAVATLRGVSKRYGAMQALSGIDLAIHRGEVVAILGPNGAGKTTAIHLMLGLVRPTSGVVRLFGTSPQDLAARRRIGAMLQLSGVPETVTVKEHLELFSSYYPSPLPLTEALALAGLTGLERRLYGKLSGGQKQRLHLALALCGDPELLFLDEPTSGLDVAARRALWETIRAFIARGRTVVLTTHDLDEADALSDRVVLLNRGDIIAEGTPAEIKARTAARRIRCLTRVPLEVVRALPGVSAAMREGAATTVLATQAEPVVLALLNRDPALRDLEVTGAGLEEAFLALTGSPTAYRQPSEEVHA